MQNLKFKSNNAIFVSKRELCLNTWEYTFAYQENLTWNPGDYTFITLHNSKVSDIRALRRHISIVNLSGPQKILKIAVRLRNSVFKQNLHALLPGDTIEFTKPYGEFHFPKSHTSPMVFIIGGIGITFCMSILEWVEKNKKKFPIKILYFNTKKDVTPYFEELQAYEKTIPTLEIVYSMTQDTAWNGESGRVDTEKISRFAHLKKSYFYSAGPQSMNQLVEDMLYDLQVPDHHIWREDFTGYEIEREQI